MVSESYVVKNFLPSKNGFLFGNSFQPNKYALGIADDSKGMCGGMVYAVKDYSVAGKIPPRYTQPPTPTSDKALLDHIRDRQMASTLQPSGLNYIFSFLKNDYSMEVLNSYEILKKEIKNNELSILGLIRAKSVQEITKNHQVAAYGYQQTGNDVIVSLYDPVYPDRDDITLSFNLNEIRPESYQNNKTPIKTSPQAASPVYSFFHPKYTYKEPPVITNENEQSMKQQIQ